MEPYQIAIIVVALITSGTIIGFVIGRREAPQIKPYPEVDDFAEAMRAELLKHEGEYILHNGRKWVDSNKIELLSCLHGHYLLLRQYSHFNTVDSTTARKHAIHLANFAMMIWDKTREDKCQCGGKGICTYCISIEEDI